MVKTSFKKLVKKFVKKFNPNVNPFTVAKEIIAPEKVHEFIGSSEFEAQAEYRLKATKGKVESHICIRSSAITKNFELIDTYKVRLNSKVLEIDVNGTVAKFPIKLIWGFLAIVTSILDVFEKITDLFGSFVVRFKSQLRKFTREFESSVTVNGETLSDIRKSELKTKDSHRCYNKVKWVTITRHSVSYRIGIDADDDPRGAVYSVLSNDDAEYGWYTVKVEGEKSFRFLYSSK